MGGVPSLAGGQPVRGGRAKLGTLPTGGWGGWNEGHHQGPGMAPGQGWQQGLTAPVLTSQSSAASPRCAVGAAA